MPTPICVLKVKMYINTTVRDKPLFYRLPGVWMALDIQKSADDLIRTVLLNNNTHSENAS